MKLLSVLVSLCASAALVARGEAQPDVSTRAAEPLSLIEVSGPLVADALAPSLEVLQPSVRECIEPTDRSGVYEIRIGRNGRVIGQRLISTTDPGLAPFETVRACIAGVLRQARFPGRHGVSVAKVRVQRDAGPLSVALQPVRSVAGQAVPAAARTARVERRQLEVRGQLSSVAVRQTVTSRLGEVRACYEFHLRHRGAFEGEGVLTFTVSTAGTVTVSATDALPDGLARCLQGQVAQWRFPESRGPTQIGQGLRFTSTGDDVLDPERWLLREPSAMQPDHSRIVPEGNAARPEIARVVRRRMHQVRACQRAAERRFPGFEGLIYVRFTILPSGTVGSRAIGQSSFGHPTPRLERCLLAEVGRWRFPGWRVGQMQVDYPFDFHPRR